MKKLFPLVLGVLLVVLMCSCSLDYSEQADEGNFSYAYGKKTAFVTCYRWDGTEEGRTIVIPEEYDGRRVVAVGGFFGRGLPMPFTVDISGYFPEDVRWVTASEAGAADETIKLDFTLVLPDRTEEIRIADSEWMTEEEGKIIEYMVCVYTEYAD